MTWFASIERTWLETISFTKAVSSEDLAQCVVNVQVRAATKNTEARALAQRQENRENPGCGFASRIAP